MTNCDDLFAVFAVVFPNRLRAILVDGQLDGLAGGLPFEILQHMGSQIEQHCPGHPDFAAKFAAFDENVAIQSLIALPPHPNIVVRYLHFDHASNAPCKVLALAAGPPDTIGQLSGVGVPPMPLTSREMQVALDIAKGRNLLEIARDHNISIHTLRNQVKSAMRSTGARSQTHLVSVARDWFS